MIPNSQAFVKRVVDTLVIQEEYRMDRVLQDIVKANMELQPETPHHGFAYNGGFYDLEDLPRIGKRIRVMLHSDLWPRMEEYLKTTAQITGDRRLISQMLAPLLQPCYVMQDVRDALPNCLTDQLEELKTLPRTRDEGYTLAGNPKLLAQFEKLKDRIHFYIALRLMF